MKCRQCQATLLYILCEKKILLECLIILQHILNAAAVLFCCFLGLNGKQAPQLCISTTCSLAYSDGNEYALSRTPDMQYHHHMSLHSGMDTYLLLCSTQYKHVLDIAICRKYRQIDIQACRVSYIVHSLQDEFWLMYGNIEYQKIFLEICMSRCLGMYTYARCI